MRRIGWSARICRSRSSYERHRMKRPSAVWTLGAPALFVVLWSSGFTFAKLGLDEAGPFALLSLRFMLVIAVLLPVAAFVRPSWPTSRAGWMHVAIVGLLIQVGNFGGVYVAIAHGVSAGTAGLMSVLQPILVALLAPRFTGERVDARVWLGLVLGLVGAALVIFARSAFAAPPIFGLSAAAFAVVAMTSATLYERRFGTAVHVISANIIQCGVGLVVVVPLAFVLEGFTVTWTPKLALALAYLVLANSLVAVTLLLAMVRRGQASATASLFFLVPPMSALVAWLLAREVLPPLGWVGMLFAAVGVALVRVRRA